MLLCTRGGLTTPVVNKMSSELTDSALASLRRCDRTFAHSVVGEAMGFYCRDNWRGLGRWGPGGHLARCWRANAATHSGALARPCHWWKEGCCSLARVTGCVPRLGDDGAAESGGWEGPGKPGAEKGRRSRGFAS